VATSVTTYVVYSCSALTMGSSGPGAFEAMADSRLGNSRGPEAWVPMRVTLGVLRAKERGRSNSELERNGMREGSATYTRGRRLREDGLRNDAILPSTLACGSGAEFRSGPAWPCDPGFGAGAGIPIRNGVLEFAGSLRKRDDYNVSTKLLSCWEASRLKMTAEQAACRNCLDFARFISTLKHLLPALSGKVSIHP